MIKARWIPKKRWNSLFLPKAAKSGLVFARFFTEIWGASFSEGKHICFAHHAALRDIASRFTGNKSPSAVVRLLHLLVCRVPGRNFSSLEIEVSTLPTYLPQTQPNRKIEYKNMLHLERINNYKSSLRG